MDAYSQKGTIILSPISYTKRYHQLKKKALKPGPEGQAAEYTYMTHVAQSNAFMQSFLNELMPKVLSVRKRVCGVSLIAQECRN